MKQCLEQKKIALQQLGQDHINLEQIEALFRLIRTKRDSLEQVLKDLCLMHHQNQILIYLVDIFESTLQFNQKLTRLLSKLKQKYQNLPKHEDLFDELSCSIFISLIKNIGEIKMVSNNFERVIPFASNKEIIGKNINCMIPSEISQFHDKILQKSIQSSYPGESSKIFSLQIAKGKDGWGVPISIRIQNFQQGMSDFGQCAILKQIIDYNIYLSINLNNQNQILLMQKKFYEIFLSQALSECNSQKISIDVLMPSFQFIFLQQKENRTLQQFQTFIIKPRSHQELKILKENKLNEQNLNSLIDFSLFLISGEYSCIDNQYISMLYVKIANLHILEEKSSKAFEIQKLKQLIQNKNSNVNNQISNFYQYDDLSESYLNQENQPILLSPKSISTQRQIYKLNISKNTQLEKLEASNFSNMTDPLNIQSYREHQIENLNQTELAITSDVNRVKNSNILSQVSIFARQNISQQVTKIQETPLKQQQDEKYYFGKQVEIEKSYLSQENLLQNKFRKNSQYQSESIYRYLSDKEIEQSANNIKLNTEFKMVKQINQDDCSNQTEDYYKEINTSQVKRTSSKKMQDGIAQSVHSQQSTRSVKREQLINQIQKRQTITGLLILKLFGVCSLVLFVFLNIYNFYQLEQEVIFQRDDQINVDWGSTLRQTISQVIGDQSILGQLKFPYFKNSPQQQEQIINNILDYQKQRYQIMQKLIKRFEQTDKSKTNLYEYVLDKKQILYFGYSVIRNTTFNSYFGYVQIAQLGYLYKISQQIDYKSENLVQLIVNYLTTVNSLDQFEIDVQDKLSQELDQIVKQSQISVIIIASVSTVVSLSFIFLCSYIQKKREEILILLTTISPQKVVQMMNETLFYLQQITSFKQSQSNLDNKNKRNTSIKIITYQKNSKYQVEQSNQNASTLVKKKKLISTSSRLPKFQLHVFLHTSIFLILTQMHAVSLLIVSINFRNNETLNRQFQNGLQSINDFVISICDIRAPLINTKLQNQKDFYQAYKDRAQHLIDILDEQQTSFFNLVEKQFKHTRYQQAQFEDYVYRVLQNDACNAVNENSDLLIEQGFDYAQCIQTQNGVLNTGLVKSVKFLLESFQSRMPVYEIEDSTVFLKIILQQENDFSIFQSYYFRIYFNYIIQTIYNKVQHLSNDYYEHILNINHILISISLVSSIFTFYLVYQKFFVLQIESLTNTKRILDVIDIHVIQDNQYMMNYFKNIK